MVVRKNTKKRTSKTSNPRPILQFSLFVFPQKNYSFIAPYYESSMSKKVYKYFLEILTLHSLYSSQKTKNFVPFLSVKGPVKESILRVEAKICVLQHKQALLKLIGSMFTRPLRFPGFDITFVSFCPCVLAPVGKKVIIYYLGVGLQSEKSCFIQANPKKVKT